jgi:predicted RNA methylase
MQDMMLVHGRRPVYGGGAERWPPRLAWRNCWLDELGEDLAGLVVLEPSAGCGALAVRAAERGAVVDCIEMVPEYVRVLG